MKKGNNKPPVSKTSRGKPPAHGPAEPSVPAGAPTLPSAPWSWGCNVGVNLNILALYQKKGGKEDSQVKDFPRLNQ